MIMKNQSEKKPLLLIVDDVQKNLQILGTLLKEDYQINLATNGKMAVEMVKKNLPDLILLDIMMPEMDGFETCMELKKQNEFKDIPIIFLTARSNPEDIVKGFEMGAVDYITKPFNSLELKVRIKNHIDLRQKTLMLQSLSERDGLTRIPNKRRFNDFINMEWRRCLRAYLPISLLMIDIDYFKLFNDNYGHVAGDECLKKIAKTIAGTFQRPGDLAARFGGEEFSVVMSDTSLDIAVKMAQQMRERINRLKLPHEFSPVKSHVTVSIGISSVVPTMNQHPEKLIMAADKALYHAKKSGRNQIQVNGVK